MTLSVFRLAFSYDYFEDMKRNKRMHVKHCISYTFKKTVSSAYKKLKLSNQAVLYLTRFFYKKPVYKKPSTRAPKI